MSGKHQFKFKLRRVMMFNHTLFVKYGKQEYKIHAEESPEPQIGLLVAFNKTSIESKFLEKMVIEFRIWAKENEINFKVI